MFADESSYYAVDSTAHASSDVESRKFGHAVREADSRTPVASGLARLFNQAEHRQRLEEAMNGLHGQFNLRRELE